MDAQTLMEFRVLLSGETKAAAETPGLEQPYNLDNPLRVKNVKFWPIQKPFLQKHVSLLNWKSLGFHCWKRAYSAWRTEFSKTSF